VEAGEPFYDAPVVPEFDEDPPVLRPMEKGVTEHRRWCRQFYSYVDETHPGLSDG
jgi:hypothetical protein